MNTSNDEKFMQLISICTDIVSEVNKIKLKQTKDSKTSRFLSNKVKKGFQYLNEHYSILLSNGF